MVKILGTYAISYTKNPENLREAYNILIVDPLDFNEINLEKFPIRPQPLVTIKIVLVEFNSTLGMDEALAIIADSTLDLERPVYEDAILFWQQHHNEVGGERVIVFPHEPFYDECHIGSIVSMHKGMWGRHIGFTLSNTPVGHNLILAFRKRPVPISIS